MHAKGEAIRVLVTGGAGFIGSHCVEALLERGYAVRVADCLATGRRANLAEVEGKYEWLQGDLADFEVAQRAAEGCERVLHLAAIPSVPRSVREPLSSHASGPTATLNILEAARQAGAARVVFAASSSAYGDSDELPKHERMLPRPLSPYAAGKLAGEYYMSVYARTMDLDTASLRYFNVFGPRQDPSSPYSGVISLFIESMLSGRAPTIFGDGEQTRDFTYVSDVVECNLRALLHPEPLRGEVFNVGRGERTSLNQLVAMLNRLLGAEIVPVYAETRPGDVRDSLASIDRLRETLGYELAVPIEEGLRRTLEWTRSQRG